MASVPTVTEASFAPPGVEPNSLALIHTAAGQPTVLVVCSFRLIEYSMSDCRGVPYNARLKKAVSSSQRKTFWTPWARRPNPANDTVSRASHRHGNVVCPGFSQTDAPVTAWPCSNITCTYIL